MQGEIITVSLLIFTFVIRSKCAFNITDFNCLKPLESVCALDNKDYMRTAATMLHVLSLI